MAFPVGAKSGVLFYFPVGIDECDPSGRGTKIHPFFMGLLLILVLIKPLLTVGNLDQILSWETLSEGIRQEYEDFSMEKKYLEQEGNDYVQENCQKEMERQIKALLEELSYESTEVSVKFFNGEELDVKEIRCVIRRMDGNPPGESESDEVKGNLHKSIIFRKGI